MNHVVIKNGELQRLIVLIEVTFLKNQYAVYFHIGKLKMSHSV